MKSKALLAALSLGALLVVLLALFFLQAEPSGSGGLPVEQPSAQAPSPSPGVELTPEAKSISEPEPLRGLIREPERSAAAEALSEGVVIGRVLEAGGEPVPSFPVEAYGADPKPMLPSFDQWFDESVFQPEFRLAQTSTDLEGRFRLKGLNPKALYVLGLGLGGGRPQVRLLDHVPSPGETVDLGDIHLEPSVTFTGRILDHDGKPRANARVRASNLPAMVFAAGAAEIRPDGALLVLENSKKLVFTAPSWMERLLEKLPIPNARSDAEGRFRLEGVPLGLATVIVDFPERPVLQHGPVPTGQSGTKDLGDLRLEEGEKLEGKVVDSTGKAIAGAEVYAGPKMPMAPVGILHPVGKTDSEGRFSAKGLKEGPSHAVARIDRGSPWGISEESVPGIDEPIITIPTGFEIAVRLKGKDGIPIANGQLLLKTEIGAKEFPLLFPPVPLQGRLDREEDGWMRISRITPGEYLIVARAPGYSLATQEISVADRSASTEIALVPESPLRVRVLDKVNGAPIANARLSARKADARLWSVPLAAASTNGAGEALLPGLASGNYMIEGTHPFFATGSQLVTTPSEISTLELEPGGAVEGRVHFAGNPPESPRMLFFEPRDRRDKPIVMPRITSTDLDGNYRITHVEPGTYRVRVWGRMIENGTMDFVKMAESGPQKSVAIEVEPGKTLRWDIDLADTSIEGPSGRLRGQVTLNGSPASGIHIQTRTGPDRRNVVTDAGGYFDFGEIRAGENYLRASLPAPLGQIEPYRLGSRTVAIKEGETTELQWDFQTGLVRGRALRDHDGTAMPYMRVVGRIESGEKDSRSSSRVSATTDESGEFVFDPAPAGKWSLSAEQAGFGRPQVEFELREGERKLGVDVLLREAARLQGRVVFPDGPKPRWIWLSFHRGNVQQAGARVDAESLTFSCDTLEPGKYQVRLNTWYEDNQNNREWAPIDLELPDYGLTDAVLRFEPKPPAEKK